MTYIFPFAVAALIPPDVSGIDAMDSQEFSVVFAEDAGLAIITLDAVRKMRPSSREAVLPMPVPCSIRVYFRSKSVFVKVS